MDNKKIISSFKTKNKLNSKVWEKEGDSYTMKPDIRESLLKIVQDYLDFIDVDLDIDDVTLTGSLSNFNWSDFSDVDLHILVDFGTDKSPLLKKYLDSRRIIWNSLRDITIKDFDVEIYVQGIHEPHFASGIYSVLFNEWINNPTQEDVLIDSAKILEKSKQWMNMIDSIEDDKNRKEPEELLNRIDKLKKKLKKYRSCGLQGDGEYSYENLTFKFLRRNNYLGKLNDIKNELIDQTLTVEGKVSTI